MASAWHPVHGGRQLRPDTTILIWHSGRAFAWRLIQVFLPQHRASGSCAEHVLDLTRFGLDEIATALSDHTDYEHRWLIDPRTGQVAFWGSSELRVGRVRRAG
jgi:hypothetical protein